jgi:hypothetical protein
VNVDSIPTQKTQEDFDKEHLDNEANAKIEGKFIF